MRRLPTSMLSEIANRVGPEWFAWYRLTPEKRWEESARLWQTYIELGGTLDPIADPERIGDARGTHRSLSVNGGTSLHSVRGGGI